MGKKNLISVVLVCLAASLLLLLAQLMPGSEEDGWSREQRIAAVQYDLELDGDQVDRFTQFGDEIFSKWMVKKTLNSLYNASMHMSDAALFVDRYRSTKSDELKFAVFRRQIRSSNSLLRAIVSYMSFGLMGGDERPINYYMIRQKWSGDFRPRGKLGFGAWLHKRKDRSHE